MTTYRDRLELIIMDSEASEEARLRARLALYDFMRWLNKTEAEKMAFWAANPDRTKLPGATYPLNIDGMLVNERADYTYQRERLLQPANTDPDREYNAVCKPAPSDKYSRVQIVTYTVTKSGRRRAVIIDPYKQ